MQLTQLGTVWHLAEAEPEEQVLLFETEKTGNYKA